MDLTHIDTPIAMSSWPQFHNGVAAALRVANSSEVQKPYMCPQRHNLLTSEAASNFISALNMLSTTCPRFLLFYIAILLSIITYNYS